MEHQTTAYEVKVQPTNGICNQFCIDGRYLDCKDGVVIVVTGSPADIFARWGEKVYSVRRIGPAVDMSPNILGAPTPRA